MSAMASLMTMPCGDSAPRAAVQFHRAELALGQLIAPIAERAFGVLHDVALVDNREALALVPHGVFEGGADETLGARLADGLDADADLVGGLLPNRIFLSAAGSSRWMNSRIFFASGLPAW